MPSLANPWSHLYIEKDAFQYSKCQDLITQFQKATIVEIERYSELFHRPRQDWRLQKNSPKLILAVKRHNFLYPGSPVTPSFGHENFYYNNLVMNCPYDCEYCYLQGMYSSSNIVVFVNLEDFFRETKKQLAHTQKSYLCLSYDSDLLALEPLLGYCSAWIDFARNDSNLTLEVRTKSAYTRLFRDLVPCPKVTFAWTLSPQVVVQQFEHGTPAVNARLKAACEALENGWKVRLCFDPVLFMDDWKNHYSGLIEQTFEQLEPKKVQDISIGTFRMNKSHFKKMQLMRPESKLSTSLLTEVDGFLTYESSIEEEIFTFIKSKLEAYLPSNCISLCQLSKPACGSDSSPVA